MEIFIVAISSATSITVALITVWLKHHLETQKEIEKRKQEDCLSGQDVESMLEVQEFLESLMNKWKFDRAGIFQFHNGGKFFNGVSMKKYSQSYEALSPGIAGVKKENQNVLVTQHPSLMKHVSENDFFYVDGEDTVLDYMREKVKEEGILQIVTCSLKNLSGSTVGFIQFFTVKKKVRITEEMRSSLLESAGRISGYLDK
jgi:hypothetical protein